MADQLLSTDPAAGQLLSTDPAAGVSGSPAVAAATSNQPAGSAVGRFVSGVAQNLNPISIVSGITQAVAHPLDTAKAQWDALEAERGKAYDLAKQGRYSEAVGHFAAGVLPLIGPPAAHAGERIASGDVAGGLGEGVGLIAPAVLPVAKAGAGAATETARAIPGVTEVLERGATAADRASAATLTDVMTPKVGPNKVRFGRMAADVAPQIARDPDLGALSRSGLADKVGAKLQEAEAALDAAADARNPNRVEYTGPILAELEARKARLTAQTARVGTFKAGEDVVPTPNAPRVAVINQAIDEIKQLGPVVNYDALRQIRQAYDGQAKAVYAPAVTADFLQKQGSKLGAADVTGVLRDRLAKFDPQTAAANATYSYYRSANDVLQAAEETERTRPKVGRQIIARLTGSVVGGEAGGLPGALAGYVAGPIADAVANSGPTLRIGYARKLASLADALRAHDLGKTISVAEQLKQMRPNLALQAAVAGNAIATQSQPNAPALASQP